MRKWLGMLLAVAIATPGWAQIPEPRERQEQAIEPRLDRPRVVIPQISGGDIEVNFYAGALNIENFGSNAVFGLRGNYHVTEDLALEIHYGRSQISDTRLRRLGIPLLPSEDERLEQYGLSLAYNVLPGEFFLGRHRALSSGLFVLAGAGNTRLASEDFFTFSVGLGLRLLPSDRFGLRLDLRDHIFDNDLLGESRRTHNWEISAGAGIFF